MADDMRDEYDFAGGVRGKFFREGSDLVPPVHLESEVLASLKVLAAARGTTLSQLVNDLLKQDIERLEALS